MDLVPVQAATATGLAPADSAAAPVPAAPAEAVALVPLAAPRHPRLPRPPVHDVAQKDFAADASGTFVHP